MHTSAEIAGLHHRHAFAVLRRCHQLLGDDAEAREVAQEVFMRFLDAPSPLAGRAEVTAHLYGMATHGCLNRLRHASSGHAAWQDSRQLATAWQAAAPPLQPAALQASLVASLLQEPDTLTALVALYHHLDGLPQSEIAKLVRRPRVTVRHRLARFAHKVRNLA